MHANFVSSLQVPARSTWTAARGLLPTAARAVLDGYLDRRVTGLLDKAAMFEQIESLRGRFAEFIGAGSQEIALTKNVSEGLNAIVAAYPWRAGDGVVICAELEHPIMSIRGVTSPNVMA